MYTLSRKYCVEFYKDKRDECPAIEFLNGLQTKIRAKVAKWIEKLEQEGPIVITHGFLKKTRKIPIEEIERAECYMQDFLNRE